MKLQPAPHGFFVAEKDGKTCKVSATAMTRQGNLERLKEIGCSEKERGRIDNALYAVQREALNEEELALLTNPTLFEHITLRELAKKIEGEVDTRKTIIVCACGVLVQNSSLASYNLLVNSESGTGKDWVTSKSLEILPSSWVVRKTRISENVFSYWHNPRFEPEWSWDGKVFYNEDISNRVLNSDVFKVMASSGSDATVLVHQTPVDIPIKGKPVMIVTAASTSPSKEILRRFTILNLDEGVEQTKAIIRRQAKLAAKGEGIEYDSQLVQALAKLKRVRVKVPFAESLVELFPAGHVIMRTHFNRFLDYVKASAALYQYQREVDSDGFHLATGQDYDIAREAILKTSSNASMIPLTKDEQRLLDVFKKLDKKAQETLAPAEPGFYDISELGQHVTFFNESKLRRELDKLAELGFLQKDAQMKEEAKKKVYVYQRAEIGIVEIPKWGELKKLQKNEIGEIGEISEEGEEP